MNIRLLSRLLGILAALIGGFMVFSLPFAFPGIGRHTQHFERDGFIALLISIAICVGVGALLFQFGRSGKGRGGKRGNVDGHGATKDKLFRKEAMAVVGLSWVLATVLGSLPFFLSSTLRGPSLRITADEDRLLVLTQGWQLFHVWEANDQLDDSQFAVIKTLLNAENPSIGLGAAALRRDSGQADATRLLQQLNEDPFWNDYLILPGESTDRADRASNFRVRWTELTIFDALFESQSGFSTTGGSIMSELEDPEAIASCIHFWRSSTHFLGGLGIIVLFVVLLGQGSAGKALMRTEVPGPANDSSSARMQHSAWRFAVIYVALNIVLTVILLSLGMGPFDAVCHAFGTMATGGFSTYNASLGHFQSPAIEYVVILFMILAGTNFTLLYLCILRQPGRLLADVEWRTYLMIILGVSGAIIFLGWRHGDSGFQSPENAFRNGLFQVVSVITTTGYGTNDFDAWNQAGRLIMLLLMFVGGCAGSTGGGMKVIRHYLLAKILWIQVEKAFHPRVVKSLKLQGDSEIDVAELKHSLLVYVALIGVIFAGSWLVVAAIEPDSTWAGRSEHKLIDSASCVITTLNNIGPGLGTVGPTQNYGHFSGFSKLFFVFLMMLGRLEIWPILVLFAPQFWRSR